MNRYKYIEPFQNMSDRVYHTGPRGGLYYLTKTGRKVYVKSEPRDSSSHNGHLTEQEEKYCRCVLHVKEKGSAVNPWAVCAKSTGASVHRCSEYGYK